MKRFWLSILSLCLVCCGCQLELAGVCARSRWHNLFDGKSLAGWKAGENKDSFSVRDGMIVVDGARSHLFYVGPIENASFKNFEFKAQVMTMPGANSGIYFHTTYQQAGWPEKGLEAQINNTYQTDPIKTGSLYEIKNVNQAPAKDRQWFTEHIIVEGKRVITKVNGKTVVDYTEPSDAQRKLSSGTFALQCHDPGSKVFFRNIKVRPLP